MVLKRAQAQSETLILFALTITASLVLLYFIMQQIGDTHKVSKADDSLQLLSDEINKINILGSGSKDIAVINLPGGIISTYVGDRRLFVTLSRKDIEYNLSKRVDTFVMGSIPSSEGMHRVTIQKFNDTLVVLGDVLVLSRLDPDCIVNPSVTGGENILLKGIGFLSGSKVFVGDEEYVYAPVVVLNGGTIQLSAVTPPFNVGDYFLSVENSAGVRSNALAFRVANFGLGCGGVGGGFDL
tara:strand:+ start:1474 stop:2193 length:720 start_codon:yes stop_codon:yes gene_type:complete